MIESTKFFLIGIDEAGRGPLAGPVVVAGVKLKVKSLKLKVLKGIRDSKKLTSGQREAWFKILTSHPEVEWAVTRVYPRVIDRMNISEAANLGANRVCAKLSLAQNGYALLDGGLRISTGLPHGIFIKGDEKFPIIAAASIIAKVTRDRIMRRLHKKYPQYRFDLHKGYPTRVHKMLLVKFGRSEVHRKTFSFA